MYGRSFRKKKQRIRTKKRALALLSAAVLAVGMYYHMPLVSLAPVEVPAFDTSLSAPVSPAAQNLDLAARDPFAVPRDFLPKAKIEPTASGRMASTYSQPSSRPDVGPQLTGVVMAAYGGSAIIQYGAVSQSYQQGDSVGPYRVIAIGQDSVTLQGPGGPLTLGMGR